MGPTSQLQYLIPTGIAMFIDVVLRP
jgi:hypothetical protein